MNEIFVDYDGEIEKYHATNKNITKLEAEIAALKARNEELEAFHDQYVQALSDNKLVAQIIDERNAFGAENAKLKLSQDVITFDPESLGRLVRKVWIAWAKEQPSPKPSWLVPYGELPPEQQEVDNRIGDAVCVATCRTLRAENAKLKAELTDLRSRRNDLADALDTAIGHPGLDRRVRDAKAAEV